MNKWSQAEVITLEKLYLDQMEIKNIARTLGRTPTAINKALTRFQIRPKQEKISIGLHGFFATFDKVIKLSCTQLIGYMSTVMKQKIYYDRYGYHLDGLPASMNQLLSIANHYRMKNDLPYFQLLDNF